MDEVVTNRSVLSNTHTSRRGMLSVRFFVSVFFFLLSAGFSLGTDYSSGTLKTKERFGRMQLEALSEPFVGIRTSDGIQEGLYSIESTGVSTQPVVDAAQAFVNSLTKTQQIHSIFSVTDPEWRRWCNVDNGIFLRQGTNLEQMNDSQRALAKNLLKASLSEKGFALTEAIRKTDYSLSELNDFRIGYGENLYYFTVMGIPSPTEPWGWQIDGHHLAINYFVLGDQVVMSPVFIGGEPIVARSGKYKGNTLLQQEQNDGLALINSLNETQQQAAILTRTKLRSSNQAEAFKDNLVLDFEGAPVSGFSAGQKQQLLDLIGLFVGNMRDEHASIRMDEVAEHLDETHFAWIGETHKDSVFYYRIHSPVVLIEFDHQNPVGTRMINKPGTPTRDHIHVTIRTPNGNDYGKDLLRQHLQEHQH
jgi:hypothetical protein